MKRSFLIFLALAPAAFASRPDVTKVEIIKAPGTRVEFDLMERHGSQNVAAANIGDSSMTSDVNLMTAKDAYLTIRFSNGANVPAGVTAPEAKVQYKIRFRRNGKIRTNPSEFEIVESNGVKQTPGSSAIDCRAKISIGESEDIAGKIVVDTSKVVSLGSCTGKMAKYLDMSQAGSRDVSAGQNFFAQSDEDAFGRQFVDQFNAKNAAVILPHDHKVTQYFQGMMERIADASDNKSLRPKVYVINAPILNAFALPGGYVYVFRGLVDAATSESEVAGVLGHEWTHAIARHGTRNMTKAIETILAARIGGILAYILLDKAAHDKQSIALEVMAQLMPAMFLIGGELHLLHNSRVCEDEADKLGQQYAMRAGYTPWGLADMFNAFIGATNHTPSKLEEALSDHPLLENRVQTVYDRGSLYLPFAGPYITTSPAYMAMKEVLKNEVAMNPNVSVDFGNGFAAQIDAQTKLTVENKVKEMTKE